jgi:plasmid stability protein
MKTTLDLPDALMRAIKLRAEQEGRKIKDLVAELLVAGLAPAVEASPENGPVESKNLPLVKLRPAQPDNADSLTTQEWCDWIKDVDLQLEVERYEKAFGHQHVDRADG